mgnify:CR=1 FL=1
MGIEAILTLAVRAGAIILFATEKLPVDIVAILALSALVILGLVAPDPADDLQATLERAIVGERFHGVDLVARRLRRRDQAAVGDAVGAGRRRFRIALDTVEERGAREHAGHRRTDTGLEVATVLPRIRVEGEGRRRVARRHRPAT